MSEPDPQAAVVAFLGEPATYGLSQPVQRIDTHGAAVFLAGPDVFKLKRARKLPYLDFSTLAARQQACARELELNRPAAPDLYLGVLPIVRRADGLHLGGAGETIDWVVHMRRFDEKATLDRLADQGPLDPDLIDSLAQATVRSHGEAAIVHGPGAISALASVLEETASELMAAPADLLPGERVTHLVATQRDCFARHTELLQTREAAGLVRRCHGDLHLGNVVMIDHRAVLFDALEFDETMATTDMLYDLAFLLMDLEVRKQRPAANRLFNRYFWLTSAPEAFVSGLALLPLFMSLRAAIRCKIALTRAADPHAGHHTHSARCYFEAACRFLSPSTPCLVAVGGLSGSGKSTLAGRLAPLLQPAPGALHLRSDIERKRLMGVAAEERLRPQAYGEAVSDQVHDILNDLASQALSAGQSAIVDAVHSDPRRRAAVRAVATGGCVPFHGYWLEADPAILRERVAGRLNDASDATIEVVDAQMRSKVGAMDWTRLNAGAGIQAVLTQACATLPSSVTQIDDQGPLNAD